MVIWELGGYMAPIKFAHDAELYVYQPQNVKSHGPLPQKPFEINTPDKTSKAKKDKDSRKEKGEKGKSQPQ